MTIYAPDHADALADVREAGAAITFTEIEPGTIDPATDLYTAGTPDSCAGYAVGVQSDPKELAQSSMKLIDPVTVLFVPTTMGDLPEPGWQATWASVPRTVARVFATAPDGSAICARVVMTT